MGDETTVARVEAESHMARLIRRAQEADRLARERWREVEQASRRLREHGEALARGTRR